MKHDSEFRVLRRLATTRLPTKWGEFQAIGFQQDICYGTRRFETAIALVLGEVTPNVPLLRIHSQCLTGDTLGSLRCDCREQLELAMRANNGLDLDQDIGIGCDCDLCDLGLDMGLAARGRSKSLTMPRGG